VPPLARLLQRYIIGRPVPTPDFGAARALVSIHWAVVALSPVFLAFAGPGIRRVFCLAVGAFGLYTAGLQVCVARRRPGCPWPWLIRAALAADLGFVTALVRLHGGIASDTYHLYFVVVGAGAALFGLAEGLYWSVAADVLYALAAWSGLVGEEDYTALAAHSAYLFLFAVALGILVERERHLTRARLKTQMRLDALRRAHRRLRRQARRLSRRAATDGLTGLGNYAHFQRCLERETLRSDRSGLPVSLILLDVDSFKDYNDTFGHPVGDRVLRLVARTVRGAVRAGDIPCRYGGDEFAVILPGAGAAEAAEIAERVRAAVARIPGRLTVSVGVATYPTRARSRQALVREADQALYLSKSRGKNQVARAGGGLGGSVSDGSGAGAGRA